MRRRMLILAAVLAACDTTARTEPDSLPSGCENPGDVVFDAIGDEFDFFVCEAPDGSTPEHDCTAETTGRTVALQCHWRCPSGLVIENETAILTGGELTGTLFNLCYRGYAF